MKQIHIKLYILFATTFLVFAACTMNSAFEEALLEKITLDEAPDETPDETPDESPDETPDETPLSLTAPEGLTVSGGSSTSLDLSWNVVTGAEGYKAYRSDTETGTYTQVKGDVTTTSYTDTGLTPNKKTYWYKISCYSGSTESERS
uniref:fibronectin type III domain-containing protein n=1 Tax=Oceanispirochaeta sp. TaxID=2035350 RepID=UPI0026363F9E